MITLNLTPEQVGLASIVLSSAQLAAIHAQEDAPVITPPSTAGPFVPPPLVAGRSAMRTGLPWTNGTRVISPGNLAAVNFWAIHFTPSSGTMVRFVGAENGGGPVQRKYVIYRADTGEVIGSTPGQPLSTVQARLAIGRPADPRHYEVRVELGVEYVLGIVNNFASESAAMYMDMFVS